MGARLSALAVTTVLAILPGAGSVLAAEAPASMTHYRCYICHSDHQALAGPAFADIAAWYRREPNAARRVADVIRSGAASGGPWHMPPHPEVSPAEARAMARYILSVAPPPGAREVKQAQ